MKPLVEALLLVLMRLIDYHRMSAYGHVSIAFRLLIRHFYCETKAVREERMRHVSLVPCSATIRKMTKSEWPNVGCWSSVDCGEDKS